MKSILLIFEDSEFERLKALKKKGKAKTWKEFILSMAK